MNAKEGMLRAPGDLRPVQLWQVPRNPRTHPSVMPPKPENYRGNRTGGAPDVVAKAAARGAGPASPRLAGASGGRWARERCRGTIETRLGPARSREREAV